MKKPITSLFSRPLFHACVVAAVGAFVALRFPHIAPDTSRYLAEAQSLATNGIFSLDGVTPTTRDVPGFPFLLAGFIKIGLDPIFWARLLNGLWLGLIALGCGRLTRTLTDGTRWRDLSAILALYAGGLFPTILGSALFVLTELPFIALWLWSHIFLLEAVCTSGRNTPKRWILSGLLLGLACYFRPIPLYYPLLLLPAAAGVAALRGSHNITFHRKLAQHWGKAAAFIITVALLVLPWTLRNKLVCGVNEALTTAGAITLFTGTVQEWYGEWIPVTPERDAFRELGLPQGENTPPAEFKRRAVENIRRDPIAWIGLFPHKWKILWLDVPGGQKQIQSGRTKTALACIWYVTLAFAAAGLWRFQREPIAWLLLLPAAYLTAVHGVLFAIARYRIPAEPYLICLAVAAATPILGSLWLRLRRRSLGPVAMPKRLCRPNATPGKRTTGK